jgi:hypothetical protein
MFGTPFRPRVESSLLGKANGDNLRSRSLDDQDDTDEDERKASRKRAWFFGIVALLFVLANQLGHVKDASDSNSGPVSAVSVSLSLSPPERTGNSGEFTMQFRLSNKGNHPVFYPVRAGTNTLIGQIVARTSPSSQWMTLASGPKQQVPAVQEFVDQRFAWIEMPPGGWIDGEFSDASEFSGEHAYAIFVKPARDAAAIRIVSKSYPSPAN